MKLRSLCVVACASALAVGTHLFLGAPSAQSQTAEACSFNGTWTFTAPGAAGPVAGQPGRIVARGTTATVSFGEPVTASVTMRARIVDGVLQVTDTRANPAALRCTETEAGQYRLNYANACGEVNLELLYEPCAGRRGALAGTTLTREAAPARR
mgnify:FL=1